MTSSPMKLTDRHYETVAKWLKEVALLFLASLVVQKIVTGAALTDPVVVVGAAVSFFLYVIALHLLLKS